MSDFPKEGHYRISTGPDSAIVLDNQNVLSGQPILGNKSAWDLHYVNGADDEKVCYLTSLDGSGYLGVPGLPLDGNVFLLSLQPGSSPSTWILRKAKDDGYTISMISNSNEYFWHLDFSGAPVMVADKDAREVQSWQFNGPY